jgi:hypothetical protein
MFERLREDWRRFKASKLGFRFRDRYRRHQRRRQSGFDFRKALYIVGGLMIAITSLLLAPLPGPGWGTFFVGLMILAGELLIVARFLDRAEMILRGPARRSKGVWVRLPTAVRILIGVIVPVCCAALGLWTLLSVLR